MTRSLLFASGVLCLVGWSPEALAHEPGSSFCGGKGCVAPSPDGVFFQARLGAAYVYDDVRTDTERYVFHGFGPAGTLVLGYATSRHFAFDIEAPLRAAPAGKLTHDGFEVPGNAAVWEFTPSVALTIFTVSGWYFRPALGGALAATSFGDSVNLRDNRWGGAASLAVGWDAVVSKPWATGAALRVGYAHIPTRLEAPGTGDVQQNLLTVSFELALSAY